MPLSRERFLLGRRRIRLVLDYLEQHLDENDISLGTLADVASLSRYHFERVYLACVGEAPMTTMRRLRLARAHRCLSEGSVRSITDLALQSGYGSVAAFSRAFSRVFARPPTQVLAQPGPDAAAPPPLDIVDLPHTPVWRLPYSGRAAEMFAAGEEFSWQLARGGARRWRHWTMHPDAWVDPQQDPTAWVRMWHCVPQDGQPLRLPGLERGFLPGGPYARFRIVGTRPIALSALADRIARETNWRLGAGPVIRHFPHVAHHHAPSERCVQFLLPVVPAAWNSNPDQTPASRLY